MDSTRLKIRKQDFTNTINQLDSTVVKHHRTEYTFFSYALGTSSRIDHMISPKLILANQKVFNRNHTK